MSLDVVGGIGAIPWDLDALDLVAWDEAVAAWKRWHGTLGDWNIGCDMAWSEYSEARQRLPLLASTPMSAAWGPL